MAILAFRKRLFQGGTDFRRAYRVRKVPEVGVIGSLTGNIPSSTLPTKFEFSNAIRVDRRKTMTTAHRLPRGCQSPPNLAPD